MKKIKLSGMTLTVKHLHLNHGLYWYKRRIPRDLLTHFGGKRYHSRSLETADLAEATRRAIAESERISGLFEALRDPSQGSTVNPSLISLLSARYGDPEEEPPIPELDPKSRLGDDLEERWVNSLAQEGKDKGHEGKALEEWVSREYWSRDQLGGVAKVASASELAFLATGSANANKFLTVGELKIRYLDLATKRSGESISRQKSTNDTFKSFSEFLGSERTLVDTIDAGHVGKWVAELVGRGCKPSTAERRLKQLKAAFNLVLEREGGHFSRVFVPGLAGHDGRRYSPTISQGREILKTFNDDPIMVLVILLGGRISEIAGLRMSDVFLEEDVPFVRFVSHPGRSLKTHNSQRDVPLVGAALTAAQQIVAASSGSVFFLSRYGERKTGGGMLSAYFNKKSRAVDSRITSHSFRHLLKDLLREVGAQEALANEIQGHANSGHAARYGRGYSLRIKAQWLTKAYALLDLNSRSLSESY
jgi:integrase